MTAEAPLPHKTPVDEDVRLAALHQLRILDTPNEPAFDRIVNLAQRIFDVPIVLVSLVDQDRQWFKAKCGLEVDETERSVSFCSHAIQTPDTPFVIPDATKDDRFRSNRLVTGAPHIRFYAGAVVRAPNGAPVGTVCIIRPTPRETLTAAEAETLSDIAALASDELLLREARIELEAKNAHLEAANSALQAAVERHQVELRAAATTQQRILPPTPRRSPGMTAYSLFLPSREVSGDAFGYGPLTETSSFFWIADVSGHGVPSALVASSLSRIITGDLLLAESSNDVFRPSEVLNRIAQRMALADDPDMYVTMLYGVRGGGDRLSIGVAGHPNPILLRPDGSVETLNGTGTPIGLTEDLEFDEFDLELAAGARLVIYSDGVLEATDRLDDSFGEDRFRSWLVETQGADGDAALDDLRKRLRDWTDDHLEDDASVIILDIT